MEKGKGCVNGTQERAGTIFSKGQMMYSVCFLIFTIIVQWIQFCCCSYLADEKTEAQTG